MFNLASRFCPLALIAAAGFLVSVSPARAEDGHPIVKLIKAGVKDTTKPFTLVVILQAKEDKNEELEAAFTPAIRETRKEKGCIHYELNRDTVKAGKYIMYERFKSLADLQTHLKAPYVKELIGKLGDFTTGPPEFHVLLPVAE